MDADERVRRSLVWRSPAVNRDLFSIRAVKTHCNVRNLPDRLERGLLPRLEDAVNAQEVFDSSSRIARRYMRLEGENWDLESDTRELTIWATGFLDARAVAEGVHNEREDELKLCLRTAPPLRPSRARSGTRTGQSGRRLSGISSDALRISPVNC